MNDTRHVRLLRDGSGQVAHIPVEFTLPGDEALMYRDGDRLVIEPRVKRGLSALLASLEPLDGIFPEIADPHPHVSATSDARSFLDQPSPSFRTSASAAQLRNPSEDTELYDGFRRCASLRPE